MHMYVNINDSIKWQLRHIANTLFFSQIICAFDTNVMSVAGGVDCGPIFQNAERLGVQGENLSSFIYIYVYLLY